MMMLGARVDRGPKGQEIAIFDPVRIGPVVLYVSSNLKSCTLRDIIFMPLFRRQKIGGERSGAPHLAPGVRLSEGAKPANSGRSNSYQEGFGEPSPEGRKTSDDETGNLGSPCKSARANSLPLERGSSDPRTERSEVCRARLKGVN